MFLDSVIGIMETSSPRGVFKVIIVDFIPIYKSVEFLKIGWASSVFGFQARLELIILSLLSLFEPVCVDKLLLFESFLKSMVLILDDRTRFNLDTRETPTRSLLASIS